MHEKENQAQLASRLSHAAQQVVVGARYRHYKNLEYTVIGLALREEDNEPCVMYRSEYGDAITWIRPVSSWIEEVTVDSNTMKRFTKI